MARGKCGTRLTGLSVCVMQTTLGPRDRGGGGGHHRRRLHDRRVRRIGACTGRQVLKADVGGPVDVRPDRVCLSVRPRIQRWAVV
jgi:hypothetical protein